MTMCESTPGAPPDADPDRDVIDLVGAGDAVEALRRLMQRYGASLYRYCRAELRDATQADDVHQQVFLEVLRDLPRFAGRSTVRVWLFAIARHRVLDAAKAHRRRQERIDDDGEMDLVDPRPSPIDAIDDARLYAALAICVAQLDEPSRTALLLHYQFGFTYDAMAQICGEQPGTLHARVARALPRLRRAIEAHLCLASAGGVRSRPAAKARERAGAPCTDGRLAPACGLR